MHSRKLTQILTDERGAALPLALIALVMLTTLIVAFSVLATTEPLIANNQLTVAQARAVAESGVERAIWALNNDTNASGLPNPLPGTVPAPYDGSASVNVSLGGNTLGVYRVTVTPAAAANERNIVSLGFLPSEASPKSKQRIQVTVVKLKFLDPPAALSVRGELQVGGNTHISAHDDTSCGSKPGTYTTGTTDIQGGSANVYGADGNTAQNQTGDVAQGQPTAAFDQYLLSDSDMAMLKAYAKSQGTYYQGTVEFSASNTMPNGVIFVDHERQRRHQYKRPGGHGERHHPRERALLRGWHLPRLAHHQWLAGHQRELPDVGVRVRPERLDLYRHWHRPDRRRDAEPERSGHLVHDDRHQHRR